VALDTARHDQVLELVESGKIRAAIDRTFALADAREAVGYAMSGPDVRRS